MSRRCWPASPGRAVSHILITHTHLDHSPAAAALQAATGAPTYGFGPHGRYGDTGESGADLAFTPDHRLGDGDGVEGPGWRLEAVHTPGHASNHLCFALAGGAGPLLRRPCDGLVDDGGGPAGRRYGGLYAFPGKAPAARGRDLSGRPMADRSAIRRRHVAALTEHRLARRQAVLAALTAAARDAGRPRRPGLSRSRPAPDGGGGAVAAGPSDRAGGGGPRRRNQWIVVSPGLSPYRLSPTPPGA